jgi:tetratricopeptide (TPR) repeat protein
VLSLEEIKKTASFFNEREEFSTAIAIARGCHKLQPKNPEVIDFLANTLFKGKAFLEAANVAMELVEKLPGNPDAQFNAAKCLHLARRAPEAEKLIRAALSARPEWLDAKLDLALYLTAQGHHDESKRILKDLLIHIPGDPRIMFNLGWHYLSEGDFKKGMAGLAVGREICVWGSRLLNLPRPIWDGKTAKGKTIIVIAEGGLGDEIISARFGYMFRERGARVVFACRPAVFSLCARVEGFDQIITHAEMKGFNYDYWVPGMDSARYLDLDYDTLPTKHYLSTEPYFARKWKKTIDEPLKGKKKFKVAIRWQGNPQFEHDQMRTIPADLLFQLKDLSGVQLYSIQRDEGSEQLEGQDRIVDLGPRLETFEDTAAAIEQMDLVVTSCTSVAHVAAGLGIPTWIIVPVMPYYLWAEPGSKSRWYHDKVRIFRQVSYQSWVEPCAEVKESLKQYLLNNSQK